MVCGHYAKNRSMPYEQWHEERGCLISSSCYSVAFSGALNIFPHCFKEASSKKPHRILEVRRVTPGEP